MLRLDSLSDFCKKLKYMDMEELTNAEMAIIKGGDGNTYGRGGKWIYDPNTGEWYWVEKLDLD